MNAIIRVQIEYHTSEYVNAALRPKRSEIPLKMIVPKNIPAKPHATKLAKPMNANGEDDVAVKSPALMRPSEM